VLEVRIAGVGVAVIVATAACRPSPCERASERTDWRDAVAACRDAYRRSADSADGVRLASALMQLAAYPESDRVARELLAGDGRAAAHRILSVSARVRGEIAAAAAHATTALAMHAQQGADAEVVRDAHALSAVWWQYAAFDAALSAAEVARSAAIQAGDRRGQGFAELARADTYRMLSDDLAAEGALDRATELLAPYCERAWVELKSGILHLDRDRVALADAALTRALASAEACAKPSIADAARLNLAWIARAGHRLDDAERLLAAVGDPDIEGDIIRALIAIDRGALAEASRLLAGAAAEVAPDADWPWLIAYAQAQVAEAEGDDRRAEAAYRRALVSVAALRARSPASAAFVIAAHRMPYEGLFALLARHGRGRDALAVIIELDAGDMLRSTAPPVTLGPGVVPDSAAAAGDARDRGAVSVDDVVTAWRGRDLVVIVAPSPGLVAPRSERAWRLRVRDGRTELTDVGAAWHASALAMRLTPADLEAAEALGAMIVPRDDVGGDLHVLPVGVVGRAPLAALRRAGALVIAERPLLRVLGVRPRTAPRRSVAAPVVVVGDPRGDLPRAAAEASWVAARLGTRAFTGDQATWSRLAGGGAADVLHVAAHTDERQRGVVLHLADRDVGPGELVQGGVGPRLAVLASCGSAAARDEGGWGSLAAALLAAGSDAVVATHWSIRDATAAELVRRFYEAGGREAPARALAAAQVALAAASTDGDWAAFTVLAGPPPKAEEGRGESSMRSVTYAAFTPASSATHYIDRPGHAVWFQDGSGGWRPARPGAVAIGTFAMVATDSYDFPAGTAVLAKVIVEGKRTDPLPPPPALTGDGSLAQYPRDDLFAHHVVTRVGRRLAEPEPD
jgi:hypothetical protein